MTSSGPTATLHDVMAQEALGTPIQTETPAIQEAEKDPYTAPLPPGRGRRYSLWTDDDTCDELEDDDEDGPAVADFGVLKSLLPSREELVGPSRVYLTGVAVYFSPKRRKSTHFLCKNQNCRCL